ncbi:MAG TPA: ABC transporter substrate-binding protein [Hyphomicrobiaceae bacterium]|nr:ABC transporter substrate-binding protein [Hyphomicrobiaceae bacterium]
MRMPLRLVSMALAVSLPSLAAANTPKKGGILTYAVTAEAPTTDCHATTTYAAVHVLAPHYSLLLKVDQDNYPKLKPDIAESWSVSPDKLAYTFKVRSNVLFHDGTPLTARDVKATFDRLRSPPAGVLSIRQALFADIVGIDTPDPSTVVMRLKAPDASFLDTLALPYNCIYSADRLAQDANYPAKTVMGSGPFVFVEHVNGSHWVGKRFDKYWDPDRPYLDGFRATFIKSQAVVTALQGGQIQAEFRSISPGERTQLVNSLKDRITVQESPWVCKMDLLFNTQSKPFDDPRIRLALSMAVDRWSASDALSRITIVKPVGGPLLPGSPLALTADELAQLPGYGRDVEKSRAEAKRLLAEAGARDLKFKLINRNVNHPFTPVGVYMVDQFRRIGVTAEHTQLDVSQQKGAIANGDYQVAIDAFCADTDDAGPLLLPYLSKERSPRNMTRNSNPQLDALYDKFRQSTDEAARVELAKDMQRKVISDANSIPVIWYSRIVAHGSNMKGWKIIPSHFANQDLAGIWLE